jgi:DNA-binding MarR family transcriptional regulator
VPPSRAAAPPLDTVVAELTLAVGQLIRRLRSEASPSELNLSQLSALARLDRSGPMTTADLARADSMKPQSMGTILAGLERDGFVERKAHPTDGRQILFALTAAGVAERRRRGAAKRDWLMAAMSQLEPAEVRALMAAVPLIKRLADS